MLWYCRSSATNLLLNDGLIHDSFPHRPHTPGGTWPTTNTCITYSNKDQQFMNTPPRRTKTCSRPIIHDHASEVTSRINQSPAHNYQYYYFTFTSNSCIFFTKMHTSHNFINNLLLHFLYLHTQITHPCSILMTIFSRWTWVSKLPPKFSFSSYSWTAHPFGTGLDFPCHS